MNIELPKKSLGWIIAALVAVLLCVTFPQRAAADDNDPPGRVARISYLEGPVSFQPAGETDWITAVTNRPMTTGDRLWADADSRAEVQIGSAIIRLDANTGFSFLNLDDGTVQIQLTDGTISLRVLRLGRDEVFEVDTPNQAFSIMRAGQYRVQAGDDGTFSMVTVRQGQGEVTGGGRTYNLASGQSGTFSGTDSLDAQVYAVDNPDDFDNWSQSRDRQYEGSRSARYVSPDVVGYQDLDNNGTWRSDPTYGNVWIPTSVQAGWAPYHNGHWVWISPWGWTWVDDEPWGYAPFHYGRWVSLRGNWGWVPGPINYQPVYAPALVAFIGGPGFGVSISLGGGGDVGWFPLGPREAYVPGYNTSRGYFDRVNTSNTNISNTTITNIYNNQVTNTTNITRITYVNRTVPGAVTAVPQNAFRSSEPVARVAVAMNPRQIASARVVSRAAVVPTRDSVLGKQHATANKVPQPSAAVANRPVVAKAKPPAPPVAFAKQQQELAKHPGQPLATHEVQSLRPASVAAAHPLVKQAPPGKLAAPVMKPGPPPVAHTGRPANTPRATLPGNKPGTTNAGRPVNAPPATPPTNKPGTVNAGHPANTPPATPPANKPGTTNAGRPANTPPATPPANKPGTTNAGRPANTPPAPEAGNRPAKAQPPAIPVTRPASAPPSTPAAHERANPTQPARADRPPSTQPNNQPPPANKPGTVNAGRPANAPPAPANRPVATPHSDQPPAQANRPPNPQPQQQPKAQPAPPVSRPVPATENRPAAAPHSNQPPAQANRPPGAPAPPTPHPAQANRPPAAQPKPPSKVQPARPVTPAEAKKAREEQKKREAMPPQN